MPCNTYNNVISAHQAMQKYGHLNRDGLRRAWLENPQDRELIERLAVYHGWMPARSESEQRLYGGHRPSRQLIG